jgi:crotonobetainyl-CoA:carnitine CoA-transferase CaiB-like acyl-CoA transferase
MILPLEGITILDLSRLLPGPFATQILADFGAEVIKIEDPGGGDFLRQVPPYFNDQSIFFHSINRGKKSFCLNLKSEEGKEIFKNLVGQADVLLEGFRPGVMDKLGLGYDVLKEINRRLIYCSISGYGNSGPYRDKAGHDLNYISYAGIAGLTGNLGEKPIIPGVQTADIGGGSLWAVMAILLALQARGINGRGQYCDISMLDGVFAWSPFFLAGLELGGEVPQRGSEILNGGYACYNIYSTRDNKYVSIGAIEPKFWSGFCLRLGKQDFIEKQYLPKAQTTMKRELEKIFKGKTRDEWVEYFSDLDVCFSPVLDFSETVLNEHLQHREMLAKINLGDCSVNIIRNPIKMSDTPARVCQDVPVIGADTEKILMEIGYSQDYIQYLREKNVL